MKLATYRDGSRDGQLVVVSRDLSRAHFATGIAGSLQAALDDWNFIAPQLQDLFDAVQADRARHAFTFEAERCLAPLPRAYQWARAESHAAPGTSVLDSQLPTLVRGASDQLLASHAPLQVDSAVLDADFGAGLAVITGDVQRGCASDQAVDAVRLITLVNDWTLHRLLDAEPMAQALHAHPATAFSPVAITPDELGATWQDGRVHLALQTSWNGRKVGLCDAGADMHWHFGELIAQLARNRAVRAGSIVGAGVVRNAAVPDARGRPSWPKGYHRIADKRAMETLESGAPKTGFMQPGDVVRIDMKGKDGGSLCGAIEQVLELHGEAP